MTRSLVGAFVAAAFAIGLVSGAAGTIVAHDTTPSSDFAVLMADHMAGYDMGSMMSGSMMGPSATFGSGMMSGPGASSMPGSQHELHHPVASQGGTR